MMNNRIFPIFLFFVEGLFGFETDGVKSLSVKEGDSVTLYTCLNQIQNYEKIQWMFENSLIAEIDIDQPFPIYDDADGLFINRLKLDFQSGSLTIRNIRTNHSGLYKVNMIGSQSLDKKFNVTVTGVFDPDGDKIKQMSVEEGDPVVLNTDVKLHKDDLMLWRFVRATEHCLYNPLSCESDAAAIAKIDGETREISLDPGDSKMFDNRLKMDKLTGSLTITNVRNEHSGFYILQISNNTGTKYMRFKVTVQAFVKSHTYTVWMSIAIILLFMMAVGCLAVGIKNRKGLFRRVRLYNWCQSQRLQQTVPIKKSMKKGELLILDTEHTEELQKDDVIEWRFNDNVIARISKTANKTVKKTYDRRFTGKLELDSMTGSLTITNITTEHDGVYQVLITNNGQVQSNRTFQVSVTDSSESEPLV